MLSHDAACEVDALMLTLPYIYRSSDWGSDAVSQPPVQDLMALQSCSRLSYIAEPVCTSKGVQLLCLVRS